MTDEKRYRVRLGIPNPVTPLDLGLDPERAAEFKLKSCLEASLTLQEFQEVEGQAHPITSSMFHETYDQDGYTIRVFLEDVLACETYHSHQEDVVNAFLESQGRDLLRYEEIAQRGRDYQDISPEAASFLLSRSEGGAQGGEADYKLLVKDALQKGLGLDDFLRPEETAQPA